MNIGVILTDENEWTASALLKNIRKKCARAFPINLSKISAEIISSHLARRRDEISTGAVLLCESLGADGAMLDAFIVRDVGGVLGGGIEDIAFRYEMLRMLSERRIMMNTPDAIQIAANKFLSIRLFANARLPVPRTVVTGSVEVAINALEEFGGIAIAKPMFGYQGRGVEKISISDSGGAVRRRNNDSTSVSDAVSKIERIIAERGVIYLQEFIQNDGRDIRVFVVGGDAVAAIYRVRRRDRRDHAVSGGGDRAERDEVIASNISMGGVPVKCEITDEMSEIAVKAAEVAGADFAGVDMIESDGLYLIEINGTPSARGIKIACGIDVTENIVEMLFKRLRR